MAGGPEKDVTTLLASIHAGDEEAKGKLVGLVPKQAYDDGHCHNGAGRRLMAQTAAPAVRDGVVALDCSFVILPRTCWKPTRTGTSLPRHHEANLTPQRSIHLPGYGADAA
jgi:hypothetical protein